MPRLWEETIDAHRGAVREATLDAVAGLVAEGGPTSVTMAAVARRAGIGRATLYKYFPDTESMLLAWHEATVAEHLAAVRAAAVQGGTARERLDAALASYVDAISHRARHAGHPAGPGEDLHRAGHVSAAKSDLVDLMADLVAAAAAERSVRDDVPARELAEFCVASASAAPQLGTRAAAARLLNVIRTALDPADG